MFAGSLVALVTPMQPDGSIDFDAWSRLIEFHVANGTTGIVVAARGRLALALALTIKGEKIAEIDVIADPARLQQLDLAVLEK